MTEESQVAQEVVADDPAPVTAPQREWSDEDAQEAKAFGWKAPDEWEGEKPPGYIDDPRRYLERAENFRPFKALREQQERERAENAERLRQLEAVTAKAIEAERARFDRELAQLNARQRQAVEEADIRTFDHLQKVKDSMTPPPEVPQQAAPVAPEIAELAAKHEWASDPTLLALGRTIVDARPDILRRTPAEQFAFADQELRRLYPAAFPQAQQPAPVQAPAPQTVARVDGGGLAIGGGKGGAFNALPAEAKSAFRRFVDQGVFQDNDADRKRYADDYNAA